MATDAPQKLGQYTLLRKIAEGGMAEIYLATRGGASGFSKNCVIKRVRDEYRQDEKFRAMFELEANLAANLDHSNIVQIFDFQSTDDGELYLAMQYVDGCSLEQLRRKLHRGIIPPYLVARIGRDVANALAYAYGCPGANNEPLRLVHRDISPHNVLISRQGEVKLTDFGIAKPVSKDTTGGIKGKIAYMSPEQARGTPVDGRTDIFALGVVLYELCTGTRPFDAKTDIAFIIEMSSGSEPAPKACSLAPNLPEMLGEILDKAVQRRPENRFQSAEEFARALEDFLRTAHSTVETDLARFMAERMGPPVSESAEVPQLSPHAFDATMASAPRDPTSVLASANSNPGDGPPKTAKIRSSAGMVAIAPAEPVKRSSAGMPAVKLDAATQLKRSQPELAALPADTTLRPNAVVVAPELAADAQPTAPQVETEPEELGEFETVEARLDAMKKKPAESGGGIFSRKLVVALAVVVPLVVAVSARFAYVRTRAQAPAPATVVVVHPEAAPTPAPAVPVAATTPPPSAPVEAPKEQPAPAPEPAAVAKPVEAKPEVVAAVPAPQPQSADAPADTPDDDHQKVRRAPVIAAKGQGELHLETFPYAEVYDGAKRLSEDGALKATVPAGRHDLRYRWNGGWFIHRVVVPVNGTVCVSARFAAGKKPAFKTCK